MLGKQMNGDGMISFRGVVVPARQLGSGPSAIIFLMWVIISAALLGVTPRTIGYFFWLESCFNGEIEYSA